MNISKAIEIVNLNINEAGPKMPPDVKAALNLLAHAGQRFVDNRDDGFPIDTSPLLGETKD